MWRKPRLLADSIADMVIEDIIRGVDFTILKPYQSLKEIDDAVFILHEQLMVVSNELFEEHSPKILSDFKEYNAITPNVYDKFCLSIERVIVDFTLGTVERNWSIFRAFRYIHYYAPQTERPDSFYQYLLSTAIILAAGTERQLLVGTNEKSEPVFLKLRPPIRTKDDALDLIFNYSGYSGAYDRLRPENMRFLPNWKKFSGSMFHKAKCDFPLPDYDQALNLMTDCYYNQRYAIDPRGCSVRLVGFGEFVGLTLSVFKEYEDSDFLSLVGLFEMLDGTYSIISFNEGMFLSEEGQESAASVLTDSRMPDSYALVAYVYHQLLTADEIAIETAIGEKSHNNTSPSDSIRESSGNQSLVIIRRCIRNKHGQAEFAEPRTHIHNSVAREPHNVTGHLRKLPQGQNMSHKHREELEKFEEKTGLRVLRYVKPGYTFVRPHVSPSVDGFDELPRFIKARMQRDIRLMIEKQETDNTYPQR